VTPPNGQEALQLVERLRPNVVLMDIRMPVLNGIEATRLISQRFPGTAVLVLTTYDLDEYVFAALDAGASGFLLKDCPPDELTSAIHVVARGLSSGELSTELFIGEATVKSHVSSLLNNLGCRDRVRLVVTAYEAGLVTPGSP
jgi:DNA-binding NarL/FixJ family response regulator